MAMVKVKLLVSRSGVGGAFAPGDIVEVSANEAQRMQDAGQAVLVREAAAPETATPKRRRKAEKASR